MLHQLQLMGLHLHYASPAASATDDWRAASALINHAAPEIRLGAVQLLSALARAAAPPQQPAAGTPDRGAAAAGDDTNASSAGSAALAAQQALVDAAFLSLCSAVSTDTVAAIRLEALLALAGMHHASKPVKLQALSKRATLRMPGAAAAAAQPRAAAVAAVADGSLLDSATGAFVHGVEDDVVQVRVAAVSAVLSLGSQDAQLADDAAELLVELAADELLPVRLAALRGLVTWADQHRQRRQAAKQSQQQVQEQQQQQQQGQQHEGQGMEVDQAHVVQQWQQEHEAAEAAEVEEGEEEDNEEEALADNADLPREAAGAHEVSDQQRRQQQHNAESVATAAAGAAASRGAGGNLKGAASPAAPASAKQTPKPSKKRKGDLPPWGTDGIAAGIAALRDSHAQVRSLALQLLALLPAASMQAIVSVLQGLISCCEQHQRQHWQGVLAVVQQVAQQRTPMVAKSCQNICKLLASAARGPEPCAGVNAAAAPAHQQQGLVAAATAPTGAAPAAAAGAAAHSPVAVELLSDLLLATAKLKASMLPALQQQLEKQGLLQAAALQPLLAQLHEMRQQRMVALQQQQQQLE